MKKILGLDIGVASIGWAFLNEPENENEAYTIIQMGSRIIPLSSDENDEFTKGNAISKNANRRIKRGMRRGGHRYKMRKCKLTDLLKELKMMPDDKLFKIDAISLYGLRANALSSQLTLEEIGRIFYHLNQKRGYKSNRKANNEDIKESEITDKETQDKKSKKKGYLDLINDREWLIKNKGLTIGQFFYEELKRNPYFRIKENIFLRNSYQEEFTAIWNKQQEFYPTVLTNENYKRIFHETIYYQRPLKSQKSLVTNCRFEYSITKDEQGNIKKDEKGNPKIVRPKAIPKSSPIFQIAKIWQDINHLKIRSKNGLDIELKIEKKQELFDFLNKNEKISVTNLKKMLELIPADAYYINLKKEHLEGNKTASAIRRILKEDKQNIFRLDFQIRQQLVANKQTGETSEKPVIQPTFEKEPLYRLWHLLYSVEEPESLIKNLQEDFLFTEEQAKLLSKLDFTKGGYGSISSKAYRKIIPHLMQGITYSEACEAAGYRHSDYLTSGENEARQLLTKLELYPKNSLRNPVVEKIVNQVINLVNAILEAPHLGRPDEIRVELGRELKQNAEERNNTFSRNNKTNDRHKKIIERLQQELGFVSVSRRDIERVKLWEEFGYVSPYEPDKTIKLSELFNGDYEIEHIIPKSRLFDDSFSNKTISRKRLNAEKDNQTAHDYLQSKGEHRFNEYADFVKKHFYKKDGISRTKLNYLLMAGDKIPADFINRQMGETAYIAREVKNLLSGICRNVYSSSGSVTAHLRESWGLNNILKTINFDKYKAAGQVESKTIKREDGSLHKIEIISNWSKRDDHRHHAVDALVVALTKQSFIQKLNTLNQHVDTRRELKESGWRFIEPWKGFFNDAITATENILVSFKAGKRVATRQVNYIKAADKTVKLQTTLTPRGFLHKEFIYGQIKQIEKIKLSPKFSQWESVAVPIIKKQLEERLTLFNNDPKKAFKENEKNPLPIHLKEIAIYKKEHVLKYKLNGDFKAKDAESIVDKKIKTLITQRLAAYNDNPKEAFKNLSENPIWLNEKKNIFITSVRCFTGLSNLVPLHKNEKGAPIDFVSTRNNHHIAIYRDSNGNLQENVVSFWDALERKKNDLPVIIKTPKLIWDNIIERGFDNQEILQKLPLDSWEFVTSIAQNEMFVFNLSQEELKDAIKTGDKKSISKNLYRVQTISESDYRFRHHLETQITDSPIAKELKQFIRIKSLPKMTGIKVKIDYLGAVREIPD
jgi:CRISPR-associated endonuclease Csn1